MKVVLHFIAEKLPGKQLLAYRSGALPRPGYPCGAGQLRALDTSLPPPVRFHQLALPIEERGAGGGMNMLFKITAIFSLLMMLPVL